MARVNTDILVISELKGNRMGKFNSDDHYIYYCGQEFLRRNGVALIVKKSLKCITWVQSPKGQKNELGSLPRQTIQYQSNSTLCPKQKCQRSLSWTILWRPTWLSRTNTKKKKKIECPFHHRGLEYKSRKSGDTWSNRQVWPWSTKWSRAKANSFTKRMH